MAWLGRQNVSPNKFVCLLLSYCFKVSVFLTSPFAHNLCVQASISPFLVSPRVIDYIGHSWHVKPNQTKPYQTKPSIFTLTTIGAQIGERRTTILSEIIIARRVAISTTTERNPPNRAWRKDATTVGNIVDRAIGVTVDGVGYCWIGVLKLSTVIEVRGSSIIWIDSW